jgi:hypothetical protein
MSERLAIYQTINKRKLGDNQHTRGSLNLATQNTAAKSAGFTNRQQATRVSYVAEHAIPEITAALDDRPGPRNR